MLVSEARERLAGATLLLVGALAGIALALGAFGGLAGEVMEGDTQTLDNAVLAALRGTASPAQTDVAHVLSFMGSELVAALLVVFLGVFLWRKQWGAAGSLLLVTGGAQLLNNLLKDLFQRTRPAPVMGYIPSQAWSFPSGHAMVAAAFYFFLAYVAWKVLRGWAQVAASGGLLVLVLLIGWSRLYLGVHYLTDVAAGYAAGAAWAATVIVAGHILSFRPWRYWRHFYALRRSARESSAAAS